MARRMRRPMKDTAQFFLGVCQYAFLLRRKARAGAIDIKIQHGHRRLIRIRLAPVALLGRTFQRKRYPARIMHFEDAVFEVQCITAMCHGCRPLSILTLRGHFQWRLKNCTCRSCLLAASSVSNVPRLRRSPVLGFRFLE